MYLCSARWKRFIDILAPKHRRCGLMISRSSLNLARSFFSVNLIPDEIVSFYRLWPCELVLESLCR